MDSRFGFIRNSTGKSRYKARRLKPGPKKVLMVGRIHHDKNPELWLNVAQEVTQRTGEKVTFIWLGNGPMQQRFHDVVIEKGLETSVEAPGFIEDPSQHYLDCDVYLHLARVEPMSNALIDALKFGLPSIASDAGGNPEAVKDGFNGFIVDLEDPSTIASKLVDLLADAQKYETFSMNSLKLFEERFSNKVLEKSLLNEIVIS